MDIKELLTFGAENKVSDLHISSGLAPHFRLNGEVLPIDSPILDKDAAHSLIYSIMNDNQKKHFEEYKDLDFSFEMSGVARFRVNVFQQERGIAAVFRTIPTKILSLKDLNCPPIFSELMQKQKGLILVTGATGSGKSTTLAAMINEYNNNYKGHILTLEDPIEFLHTPKKSIVNQREIGAMTQSFDSSLKAALREDPDLILVGEMRDLETIRLAITAAETGHLVLGTLHSSSASKTIDRIINVFPAIEQEMIRTMLSESLTAIISQCLVPRKDGKGRVAAHEILIGKNSISNLIRTNKIAQIYSTMQTSASDGMITMNDALKKLVNSQTISKETADLHSS